MSDYTTVANMLADAEKERVLLQEKLSTARKALEELTKCYACTNCRNLAKKALAELIGPN